MSTNHRFMRANSTIHQFAEVTVRAQHLKNGRKLVVDNPPIQAITRSPTSATKDNSAMFRSVVIDMVKGQELRDTFAAAYASTAIMVIN